MRCLGRISALVLTALLAGTVASGGPPPPTPTGPADPAIAYGVGYDLWVMNDNGSHQTPLNTAPAGYALYPTWSPDGSQIAFMGGSLTLWRIDVEVVNGEPQGSGLTFLLDEIEIPQWSPRGDWILFPRWEQGSPQVLQILSPVNLELHDLHRETAGWLSSPAWSPDGTRVAFSHHTESASRIEVLDLEYPVTGPPVVVSVRTVLSWPPCNLWDLDWARTQDVIAFRHSPERGDYLYLLDLDTGNTTLLFDGASPSWAPDDSQLVYEGPAGKGKWGVAVYDFATSESKMLARDAGGRPDWKRAPQQTCETNGDCDDANECTIDTCVAGTCQHDPVADNTPCGSASEICCAGSCVQPACTGDSDCDDSDICTDDFCREAGTCAARCESVFEPSNDPSCECVPSAPKEKGRLCRDGIDNDCDGLIDGEDPDCQ